MPYSIVIELQLFQQCAVLEPFNLFDQVFAQSQISQLRALFEVFNSWDAKAHCILDLSVFRIYWTVFATERRVLYRLSEFLGIFSILFRFIFLIILYDHVALSVEALHLDNPLGLPLLLFLFKDLRCSLLFFFRLHSSRSCVNLLRLSLRLSFWLHISISCGWLLILLLCAVHRVHLSINWLIFIY